MPRATLREKLEVLDYLAGPPRVSQLKALAHFKQQQRFAISQATLSNWALREAQIRRECKENPNLVDYRKIPVMKHPDVTRAVEKYVEKVASEGQTITDGIIRSLFTKYLKEFGYSSSDFKISGGMLHSFKKRNSITGGKMMKPPKKKPHTDLDGAEPVDSIGNSPAEVPGITPNGSSNQSTPAVSTNGSSTGSSHDIDLNFDELLNGSGMNNGMGFNTRLIHSDDSFPSALSGLAPYSQVGTVDSLFSGSSALIPDGKTNNKMLDPISSQVPSNLANQSFHVGTAALEPSSASPPVSVTTTSYEGPITKEQDKETVLLKNRSLPYYPKLQSPMQYRSSDYGRHQRQYTLQNFAYARTSHPNSEKAEKILQNITDGYVTVYNSGTSAIMGILSYLNPPMICINNSGYQGTHQVINLLTKLTGAQKKTLDEIDKLVPRSVVLLETPMNPEGYLLDIAKFSRLAREKHSFLLVDSTLAPPPLQFPFKFGADFIVYSAVKYLAGVSDLSAGFVVSRHKADNIGLHHERFALGTNIANFDSFLLLRSLRTYKMRILTQCSNTKKVVIFLQKHMKKYTAVVTKLHHSSLQTNNDCFQKQLNGYYNPVFALEFKRRSLAEAVLDRFNFLSNNPNLEGGETLVELTFKNPNFIMTRSGDENKSNLLRFSIGCEDYADIIRDIDQAITSVVRNPPKTH